MPNKKSRHKRGLRAPEHTHAGRSRKGDSVKALLARLPGPALTRIAAQATSQGEWRQWLTARLPVATAARLTGVVERGDSLVVFTESAAWSARARYAVAELEAEIRKAHPRIREIVVRVMPRS